MILRLFTGIVRNCGTGTYRKCAGRLSRTLLISHECDLLTARHLCPRFRCQTDFSTHADKRRNDIYAVSSGCVSRNCLTLKYEVTPLISPVHGNLNEVRLLHSQISNATNKSIKGSSNEKCKEPPFCQEQPKEEKTLFQNFKQMYRDYWYVLVPVHVVTSILWFGGFYYVVKSGVDVVALLEKLGLSEQVVEHFRDSKAGYLAMTFALYKLASPLRYMVTIGGSTITIKWLRDFGYIKPLKPQDIKELYKEQRKCMKEKRRRKKELKEKR